MADEANNSVPAAAQMPISQRADVSTMSMDAMKAEYAELGRTQYVGHGDRLARMEKLSERIHGGSAAPAQAHAPFPDIGQGEAMDPAAFDRSEATFDQASEPLSALDYSKALPGHEAAELRGLLHKEGVSPAFANQAAAMESHFAKVRQMSDAQFDAAVDTARDQVLKMHGGDRIIRQAVAMLNSIPAGHRFEQQAEMIATTAAGLVELARLYRVRGRAA